MEVNINQEINKAFEKSKEKQKEEFKTNPEQFKETEEQKGKLKTDKQNAQENIEEHLPEGYKGEYKEPKSEYKGPNGDGVEPEQNVLEIDLGKSSLMMKDTKLDTKSNAKDDTELPDIYKPTTEEELKMNKVIENLLNISKGYLASKFKGWVDGSSKPHDIELTIRATEQLTEATNRTACLIFDWVKKNFPEHTDYAKYLKFDLIRFNPTTEDDNRRDMDLEPSAVNTTKYLPKDLAVKNTTVYSINTKSDVLMQKIKGSNRLILTEKDDDNEALFSSNLSDLADGIYIYTKKGEFVAVDSYDEIEKQIDKTYKKNDLDKYIEGLNEANKESGKKIDIRSERLKDIANNYFKDRMVGIDLEDSNKEEAKEKDTKKKEEE